jgi:hypothetical protein
MTTVRLLAISCGELSEVVDGSIVRGGSGQLITNSAIAAVPGLTRWLFSSSPENFRETRRTVAPATIGQIPI